MNPTDEMIAMVERLTAERDELLSEREDMKKEIERHKANIVVKVLKDRITEYKSENAALKKQIEARDRVLEKRERWWMEKCEAAEKENKTLHGRLRAVWEIVGYSGHSWVECKHNKLCAFCRIRRAILDGEGE